MPIINRIAEFQDDMTAWRRHIHQHPETAFEEHQTSDYVALRLHEFGIDVHRGLAGTGVVGTLRGEKGDGPAIGLRADMDALDIEEKNEVDYKSENPGKMHACGHDGHSTMLLGAAKYLAETKNFAGTVHFIFQPAEENEGGGRVMIEEGLFDKFPVESVYGMHNMPGIPAGEFAIRPGPIMASFDIFEITLTGTGTHAALPQLGRDAVVAGAQLVTALQTIASRTVSPFDAAVVSVTQMHAGDTWNVIPEEVVLRGTTRAFKEETQTHMEAEIRRITDGIATTLRHRCQGPLRTPLPADHQRRGGDRPDGRGRKRTGRRRHGVPRQGPDDGRGRLRLHAQRKARRLYVDRQRPAGRRLHAAQPALRL